MADYAEELEASFKQINEGDILTGTVIGVTETEITLDFGYYTDGVIRLEDASDDPAFSLKDRIEVGQTLSATVIRRDDGAGHILLSMKEAAALMAWDRLRELEKSQENITVKITGVTRGGAIAYVEGIRGFIPASKLSLGYVEEDDLPNWLNKTLEVRVITADEGEKRWLCPPGTSAGGGGTPSGPERSPMWRWALLPRAPWNPLSPTALSSTWATAFPAWCMFPRFPSSASNILPLC